MSEVPSPSRQAADRIAQHLKRGLSGYFDHWQEWLVPVLVAGALVVVSSVCCLLPYLIVDGPISCGLYLCALRALRGGPVELADLHRGWTRPVRAIVASLVINVGSALPAVLLYLVFIVFMVVLLPRQPAKPCATRAGAQEQAVAEGRSEGKETAGDNAAAASVQDSSTATESHNGPPADAPECPAGTQRQTGEKASPVVLLGMFAGMLIFFIGLILCVAWALWFGTRTMFVLPLIADRGLGAVEALRLSWRETRVRFWDLLAINFVAGLIVMAGMQAIYIGLIFTVPISLMIIASVYEERFGKSEPIVGTNS
jgi:hypothetical protein